MSEPVIGGQSVANAEDSSGTNKAVRERAVEWIVSGVKILGPAIGAIVFLYASVNEHQVKIERMDRELIILAARMMESEKLAYGLKATQEAESSAVKATLRRLEDLIKEIRQDVKDLQRRP